MNPIGNILGGRRRYMRVRRDRYGRNMTQADLEEMDKTLRELEFEREGTKGAKKEVAYHIRQRPLPKGVPEGKFGVVVDRRIKWEPGALTDEQAERVRTAREKHRQGAVGMTDVITEVTDPSVVFKKAMRSKKKYEY